MGDPRQETRRLIKCFEWGGFSTILLGVIGSMYMAFNNPGQILSLVASGPMMFVVNVFTGIISISMVLGCTFYMVSIVLRNGTDLAVMALVELVEYVFHGLQNLYTSHTYGWKTIGKVPYVERENTSERRECGNCGTVYSGKQIRSGTDIVLFGFRLARNEETNRFDCIACNDADSIEYQLRSGNPDFQTEADEAKPAGDSV